VLSATQDGGYGNILTIGHGDGVTTRYGHLSAFKARPGDRVRRGDVVAYVGNTGRSTGAHVHYEILEHGTAVNPADQVMDNDED
jgi:murein DD-endopeptidase MepM/ murein hydrolase activator NlpD